MNAADHAELLRLETCFHLGLAEALVHGMAGEEVADLLGRLCLLGVVPGAVALQERNKHHGDFARRTGAWGGWTRRSPR